jgi:hypothetical protein
MTIHKILLSLLILAVSAFAADKTIPISDETSSGSPLANTGQITMSETITNGRRLISRRDEWTVRNASHQPIIAFIETMSVTYPDGEVAVRTVQHEAFFDTRLLNPGDVMDYSLGPSRVRSLDPKTYIETEPTSLVRARWVQFSDGTSWGDPQYAADLMQIRRGIWNALTHLTNTYKARGAEEFLKQLNKPQDGPEVDGFIWHLRNFLKDHDAEQTFARVKFHLAVAEQRSAFMR